MNTQIYWCDKCGRRFTRESSADAPGEAGSIFCTDCAGGKGTRLSTGKVRPGLRASQASMPPASRSTERPPSERLHVPHHSAPSARSERVRGKPRISPVLLVTALATMAVVAVSIPLFALRSPKSAGTVSTLDTPVKPSPSGTQKNVPAPKIEAAIPPAAGPGGESIDDRAAAQPVTAADAETRARTAFDALETQLRQLPEGDIHGRLSACEEFLKNHGTTILGARVRAIMADIRRPPPAAPLAGVTNLAQGKPVRTSVQHEADRVPERAVDGNTDREAAWFGRSSPAWLTVDLGQAEPIDCIDVFFYNDGTRYYQYTLDLSEDDRDYKTVVDMSRNQDIARADGTRHVFPPVKTRFVRVNILKNSANSSVHLVEVKVYARGNATAQPAPPSPGGKTLAQLGVTDFQGGQIFPNFKRKSVDGRAIWGLHTDEHLMKGDLKLDRVPTGALALEIRSLRNDPPAPPASIRISINETVVYEGRDRNISADWRACRYELPQNLLKQGDNSVEIVCTEDSNAKGRAPWFMLNELKLVALQPEPLP